MSEFRVSLLTVNIAWTSALNVDLSDTVVMRRRTSYVTFRSDAGADGDEYAS